MTVPLGPGIHTIPMDAYVADPCRAPSVSSGVVQRIWEQSPRHAFLRHPRGGGWSDGGTRAQDLGSAAHAVLLGGDERIVWVEAENWRTKAAREARDGARAEGRIPLLEHQRDQLDAMLEHAREALSTRGAGTAEQTLIWQWGDVWCRSRPDWISEDRTVIVDYKTTSGAANPLAWIRSSLWGRNDVQAALALRGLVTLCGEAEREWLWLIQETSPPYSYAWAGMVTGSPAHEFAAVKCMHAVDVWGRCLQDQDWPSYSSAVAYADVPPAWAMAELEAKGIYT